MEIKDPALANALKGRKILPEDKKKFLLDLKYEDIDLKMFRKLFSETYNKTTKEVIPAIIPRGYKLVLKKGEYINTEDIETTPGIFIFNKIFIEGVFEKVIDGGYFNYILTKKTYNGKLIPPITKGIMDRAFGNNEGENIEVLITFLKKAEYWGLKAVGFISPSLTKNTVTPLKKVMEEKKKLVAELGDDPTLDEMVKVEDKLVAMSREILKDDPGMILYDSGARGSFDNDYKNDSILIGPSFNVATNKFDFMESNYMNGISKQDIQKAGNAAVAAAYPKAVGTADAGYLTKKFYAVFQSITLDEKGTNCGSKGYLEFVLTNDNFEAYKYQNIIDGNRLVPLTDEVKDKYINKKIKLRSPMFCLNEKICNACAGERLYLLGIKNIGATTPRVTNNLLNKQMKRFHNTKVKLDKVDINKLII